jgi:protein-tyrosine-phosphatase
LDARVFNVLFLCTGNSARSILAEALVNHWGEARFCGFSAGSHPKGRVHPLALELLTRLGFPTADLRSKDWSEFSGPDAPGMDFVVTVCDKAAAESCPVWPGQPMTAHWSTPDPAAVRGDRKTRMLAFRRAFSELEHRIRSFISLPVENLEPMSLQKELDAIGRGGPGL